MFYIKYNIIKPGFEKAGPLSEEEIHYDILLGNVKFEGDGKVIEMDWDWIPMLDFSYCLKEITKALGSKVQGSETFEFTESEATLIFSKDNDKIEIKPSFSSETMGLDFREFLAGVKKFYDEILEELRKGVSQTILDSSFGKYWGW